MNKIEKLYKEWQSLQPLKSEDRKRLDDKFRLEFNYNSNHLEGNTLTYGQTKLLLLFGETEGRHGLREFEEMKAHDVALRMVKEAAADRERPLTESFIRELNRIILVEPFAKVAETADGRRTTMEVKIGDYKSRPNHVRTATGEIFHYATPEETPSMMTALVGWYNCEATRGDLTPLQLASLLHYRYIRIHPFEDGNGRIARLLVNYTLLRYGYPMLVVQAKDKDNYLRILHACDVAVGLTPSDGANAPLDKILPFAEYMSEQLEHSLDISIKAAKGESIDEEDDFEKQLSLLDRRLKVNAVVDRDEAVREIVRLFYMPFTEKIMKSIQAVDKYFEKKIVQKQYSVEYEDDGLNVASIKKIADVDSIQDVSSVFFVYSLQEAKEPKLKGLSFHINFRISFNPESYIVSFLEGQTFRYGQYPAAGQMDAAIAGYKKEILSKIEEAINKAD